MYQKGWTQTAIAKETGFNQKTIHKYLNEDKLPERKVNKKKKESKLDPYKNYLLQRIQEGTTNCVVLLEEIQAMGYTGIPEQILYDNMKTVVLKHTPVEIRFNRKFEDFLAYYGIIPKACRPKRPQTKGKVERVVKYLKENFFQRKHESTLQALNEDIRTWLDQVANRKPNQTTKEPPIQRFEKEQKFLQSRGVKPLFPTNRWETREVSRDCFVSYRGKKYSVPYRYAGQTVKIKETLNHHIEIYDEQECIARHPIWIGQASTQIRMEHYEGIHSNEKGQKIKGVQGLATNDLSSSAPSPKVEQRPLAAYAALEEGETV